MKEKKKYAGYLVDRKIGIAEANGARAKAAYPSATGFSRTIVAIDVDLPASCSGYRESRTQCKPSSPRENNTIRE